MNLKLLFAFAVIFLLKQDLFSSSNPIVNPYSQFFENAYSANPRVPKGILEAVAFSNTRFDHIIHNATTPESCMDLPKAYGVMGLTLDGKNYFRENLGAVSKLSGIDEQSIISDPEMNILAYAKAYSSLMDLMNISSHDPAEHVKVLVGLSELPLTENLQDDYAINTQLYSIYDFLNNPEYQQAYNFPHYSLDLKAIFGESNYAILSASSVMVTNTNISNGEGQNYQRTGISTQIFSTNYGPAIWNPTSCNYSSRNGTAISAVTIHTTQGSYAGSISWFKNCSAQVSAHYVVRSSDGQITQMVLEVNKAWHVGIHNPYTIGIEHEGYVSSSSWYTNAMYISSANLVKDICLSGYGIAPTTCYNGPSCTGGSSNCLISTSYRIKGHQQYSSQTHTDPGIFWDWPKYYCLINNCGPGPVATPPPPSVSSNLCDDKILTRATPPSGITYYWQGTSCGTSTSNSALTYTATVSGTYYLRAKDNSSNTWSSCSSVNVTVNQVPNNPPAPTVSSSNCGLTVLTHAAAPSGVTYYWQGTSCGTSTGNSASSYSATVSGTYYLRARSSAGCWSQGCSSVNVNVTPSPSAPPIPSQSSNSCGPKTLTRATPPAGTTYYWQGTSCGTSTLNSAATYTVGTSGTYYLRAKNTQSCWSNCSSLAVNITPCPSNLSASVGGACPNKTVNLTWTNATGAWTVQVSLDPAFNTMSSKTLSNVSSVTAPSGFSPALVLQPNATYYWRIKSGSSYFNGPNFTIPFCDMVSPSSTITAPSAWLNSTFTVGFSDIDNNTIGKRFYNVTDFDGAEWRANGNNGFFNDNFNTTTLHSDWSSTNGQWAGVGGNLYQSDETSANTDVSAAVTQSLSNLYLYHWDAKIDGSGTSRKGGLHFFADNISLSNRGNSYLVQFDIDNGKLEFYKSVANTMSLVKSADYNFIAGQYYDFKLIYNRVTGKMDLYINDMLAESWVDATPLTSGNFISFRTNNANMDVNYVEVLRSRNTTVTVTAGAALTNDIRYQNAGPSLSAGKIQSLITDSEGNISVSTSVPVNVDWTPPPVTTVNDGTGSDINSTILTNQLWANWQPVNDPNSGLAKYYYSIGINPGDSSVTGWTDNNLQQLALKNNLSLTLNQVYYFNVMSKNGAGLFSSLVSSNGQTVVANAIGIEELTSVSSLMVYPNPFNETAFLDYTLNKEEHIDVTLTDILGRPVAVLNTRTEGPGNHRLEVSASELNLAPGLYFLKFSSQTGSVTIKLILNR